MWRVLVLAPVIVAALPRHADACGVVPVGQILGDAIVAAFDSDTTPVSTPIAMATAGATTEGWSGGVAVGWAWGQHQEGGLFPGSTLHRVLVHVRRPFASATTDDGVAERMTTPDEPAAASGRTHVGLTYGWYDNSLLDLAFDAGIAGSAAGVGPTAQVTIGHHGIDLRLSAGMELGETHRATGAAELVIDVMALAKKI